MATTLSVSLGISALADYTATTPHEGAVTEKLLNNTGGRQWTNGIASGQADRVYRKTGTLAAAATDSFNTLAAGALLDVYGQGIDLDELKGLVIKCTSGSIKLDAPAANFIGIFADASDLIKVPLDCTMAFDFGASGLDVTTNSKFDVVDLAGGAGSTYELMFWGAQ